MKIAYMFSGQGAQYVGMGKELYDNNAIVKDTYDSIDNILDFKITDICFNENEFINNTMYTQPCLLATSIALSKALGDIKPDYALGLSLGEYSALVYSGALEFSDAIKLVHKRGTFMNEAVDNLTDATGMYAVLKLTESQILEIIDATKNYGIVEISNYNTDGQIVIAGEEKALEKCVKLISEQKGKAIKLNVSGPFHTSLLKSAADKFNIELKNTNFSDFDTKVVTNLTAKEISNKSELVDILTNQVKSSVKWQQSIEFLLEEGVDTFVEIGPTKTLSNFVKKINRNVTILNVEDLESLNKTLEHLRG